MAVLRGLGVYLPEGRLEAREIASASGLPEWVVTEKLGIRSKLMPGPEDGTTAMAIRAARAAIDDAGIAPEEIDVVLSITEEHKEYPVWTTGPHIAGEIGASRAWAFDANQKCGTFIMALSLARGLIHSGQGIRTVLIAGGYRNGDLIDFRDPNVRFMYDLAAGGGAAVVTAGGPGLRVLSTKFLTDGSLARCVLVPVGGTEEPMEPGNRDEYRLVVTDPELMKERLGASMPNFIAVIRDALQEAGYGPEAVDYLALLHMKRSAHRAVLDGLDLSDEKCIYLEDYGHIGQIDQILSLRLAMESGKLVPGNLAVLASAGVGYVWNAAVVRWEDGAELGRPLTPGARAAMIAVGQ